MRPDFSDRRKRGVKRALIGALAGLTILGGSLATGVHADPAEDALAKLNELSHQAEIATENMHAAQLDLDEKLAAQAAAEEKHNADLAAADAAKADLAKFQTSVNNIAAAQYMGGRTDGLDAMLTASSPQVLIDQLAVQRVMATEMSAQMQNFKQTSALAAQAESASARSAADAKTAAEQAAAVRADLQSKQSKLQVEIAVVKSQYERLTPAQRETLAAIPPVPAPGSGGGSVAVQAALTRIGSPYSWGAEGPGAFDCSGLVKWAFGQAGISLPHSSYALAAGGQPVSTDQMQPGDVVSYYSDASHVGIYIGNGMMVHASTFGQPVVVAPVNNAPIYNVRRY
ncbi:NlpC/P60 family protein [Mycolicibacterium neoaurum]|uniref:Cell wall-associated hydrolase, invasion-associated protein n=1 Tax=Mycolicibacterium neoaurum TaxID=1795 RepID=A0AAV2WL99_MYCNE|nr:NlpC/P60 family protein [Mycolicibacterium neoaurum]CDQ45084.1 cell wall-associated hydrolase, invasion-associated protein [Mycolicibacterium neoaurum]